MNDAAPQQPPSLDTLVAVTLSIAQWRGVLEAMSGAPYRMVAPLVAAIEGQCNAQIARMQRGNGALEAYQPPASQ